MIKLLLFGTEGCHLCEQAEELIEAYRLEEPNLQIEKIDIADQEQWQERYAVRIPVLYHVQTDRELGWPFDLADIKAFLQALAPV